MTPFIPTRAAQWALALGAALAAAPALAADCVNGINNSGNCNVPAGVTSITIQAWGGGGAGKSGTGMPASRGGGGGGGSYCSATFAVTPGQALTVSVAGLANGGANGKTTTVSGTGISGLTALGGYAGDAFGIAGTGGTTDGCTAPGAVAFRGGAGGSTVSGGGGGGSATTASDGGNASGTVGGTGAGNGGNGGTSSQASTGGSVPGGGGGGGADNGPGISASTGAPGRVVMSFTANAAPVASDVVITGLPIPQVGQTLTGSYTYTDADSDPEGASTFQWKRGGDIITGATSLQYTPVADDVGHGLTFCVTPAASSGTAAGAQACSNATAPVVALPVDGACGAAAGQSSAQAPTANLCSAGTPGPISSANGLYSWTCQGLHGGNPSNACQAPWADAGGGNSATVALQPANNWQVASASFSPTPPQGVTAPPNATFPAGLLSLNLSSGTQGSDASVTLRFTSPIPQGAVYMKYGPSPDGYSCQGTACAQDHWYELPASHVVIDQNRLSATLTLTDGGMGDHDGAANQFIQDPGGFALLAAPGAGAQAIPTLTEWGMLLLSALAAAFGMRAARGRRY